MMADKGERLRFPKRRGFWLRCFLGRVLQGGIASAICVATSALAQTVCVGSPEECREAQKELCAKEPSPANLLVAHTVHLSGIVLDSTGARVNFDAVMPDRQTIVQIKSPSSGAVLFAVPLRSSSEFEFELVPEGAYRLILVWMKDGRFSRLPLADQPKEMRCSDFKECRISPTIAFHGTDNPIDLCPPK